MVKKYLRALKKAVFFLKSEGYSICRIAKKIGVHQNTIYRAINGHGILAADKFFAIMNLYCEKKRQKKDSG